MMIRLMLALLFILNGCGGLALGAVGAGSAVRDEIRFRALEEQVKENSKFIDFLLEERELKGG
tara:strand:+ start:615 stop:803 length:189 start_codon:yes stop_codon:yes gene_type:complete